MRDSVAFLKERAIEHQKRLRRLEIAAELAEAVQAYLESPDDQLRDRLGELSAKLLE